MIYPAFFGPVVLVLAFLCSTVTVQAADLERGQKLARQCSACHGKNGLAKDPEVPNLAGQSALYIEKSLKKFREGAREDRRMTIIAEGLSDEDIHDLAAWYSAFVITVEPPQK